MNAYIVVGLCAVFVVVSTVLVLAACMLSSQLSQKRNEP
jgi:hypothetical protein